MTSTRPQKDECKECDLKKLCRDTVCPKEFAAKCQPSALKPQHCDHECVCLFFDHDSKIAKHDGTPCMRNAKGCANCCRDTRPHTSAPAPETTSTNGSFLADSPGINCRFCDEWDAAVDELTRVVYFKTKRMDIRSLVAEAAFSARHDHNWLQRHDAQIAKAERERIIKELESWNPFKRTFGSVLESLRSQQEAEQPKEA